MKVYARLYKLTPEQVSALPLSQLTALLPDEVEKKIMETTGQEGRGEQVARAILRLKQRFPERETFDQQEVEGEIWSGESV